MPPSGATFNITKSTASDKSTANGSFAFLTTSSPTIFMLVRFFNSRNSSMLAQGCSTYSISPTALRKEAAWSTFHKPLTSIRIMACGRSSRIIASRSKSLTGSVPTFTLITEHPG
ncbi:unannotated protein [freshwater metagenome]|uniref:Unannotated protein n=1 Tax=freshwater metagenome TaxID=449393 RepID=A0A6J6N6J7_9ZZZZ